METIKGTVKAWLPVRDNPGNGDLEIGKLVYTDSNMSKYNPEYVYVGKAIIEIELETGRGGILARQEQSLMDQIAQVEDEAEGKRLELVEKLHLLREGECAEARRQAALLQAY